MVMRMKMMKKDHWSVGDDGDGDGDGDGEDGELASDQRRSVRFRRKQGVSTGRAFKLSRCRNMMNIGIFINIIVIIITIIIVIITIIIIIIIGD